MIKNIVLDVGGVLVDFRWKELMLDLGFSNYRAFTTRNDYVPFMA